MNITKLRFESENIVVHYICFNTKGFIEFEDIKKIAFYLFESFGFSERSEEDYNPQIKSYWVGTQIHFTGDNGTHLYNRVKKTQFHWGIFDGLKPTLSRIDVC